MKWICIEKFVLKFYFLNKFLQKAAYQAGSERDDQIISSQTTVFIILGLKIDLTSGGQ